MRMILKKVLNRAKKGLVFVIFCLLNRAKVLERQLTFSLLQRSYQPRDSVA